MVNWVLIGSVAYILLAINGVADKFLLTKAVGSAGVYAFFVGVNSLAVLVLAPFGLHPLVGSDYLIALASGASFTFALYFLYSSIQRASISRVLPIEGGLVPLFTLILAYLTRLDALNQNQFLAFGLLVIGAVLIDFKKTKTGWQALAWGDMVFAAFLFAVSFVLTKYIYTQTNFISGLIWTRLGLAVGAAVLLLSSRIRREVWTTPQTVTNRNKFLFYFSHIAGASGGLLQNYAIALGSVVIVNALQGIQFIFVLLLSVFFSRYAPAILKEDITGPILAQKIIAIVLVTGGLILLNL